MLTKASGSKPRPVTVMVLRSSIDVAGTTVIVGRTIGTRPSTAIGVETVRPSNTSKVRRHGVDAQSTTPLSPAT